MKNRENETKREMSYLLTMVLSAILLKNTIADFLLTAEGLFFIVLVGIGTLALIMTFRVKSGSKIYILLSFIIYFISYWKGGGTVLFAALMLTWVLLVCLHGKTNVFFD